MLMIYILDINEDSFSTQHNHNKIVMFHGGLMSKYYELLKSANDNNLPTQIDERSGIDLNIFRELFQAGFISAIDASSSDDQCYLDVRITSAGRQELQNIVSKSEPWWKDFSKRVAILTIIVALLGVIAAIVYK